MGSTSPEPEHDGKKAASKARKSLRGKTRLASGKQLEKRRFLYVVSGFGVSVLLAVFIILATLYFLDPGPRYKVLEARLVDIQPERIEKPFETPARKVTVKHNAQGSHLLLRVQIHQDFWARNATHLDVSYSGFRRPISIKSRLGHAGDPDVRPVLFLSNIRVFSGRHTCPPSDFVSLKYGTLYSVMVGGPVDKVHYVEARRATDNDYFEKVVLSGTFSADIIEEFDCLVPMPAETTNLSLQVFGGPRVRFKKDE